MKKLYLFVAFLVIYEFTTYVANDMIMPGMLHVVKEFHAPISYVSLCLTVYILGNCLLQLFLGPLSERYGKRKVILTGNVLFFCTSVLIMFAQTIEGFMLIRFIEGMGLGFISLGYALIHEKFDDKTAVKTFALMANVTILAPLIGPLLGVAVLTHWGWRAIFIVISILSIIAYWGLFKYTPKSEPPKKHMSWMEYIHTYKRILCVSQFTIGTIAASLAVIPLLNWIAFSPIIVMKVEGHSMTTYAIYQVVAIGGLMLSGILMQFIAGKWRFTDMMTFMAAFALIGLILNVVFQDNLNVAAWGMCIYSFGFGIFNNLVMRLVMIVSGFPQSMISSLMVFFQTLFLCLGIEISTCFLEKWDYSLASYSWVNLVPGLISFVLICFYAHAHKNKEWD